MTRVEADIQIRQISEILKFLPGTENIVLCGASSYEQKYYFNQDFKALPDHIKKELQIMCVLFTEDIGGVDRSLRRRGSWILRSRPTIRTIYLMRSAAA